MVFAVCPSYVDSSFLIDGPCNEVAWLCYIYYLKMICVQCMSQE